LKVIIKISYIPTKSDTTAKVN